MALGQQQTLNSKGFLTHAPSGTHGTRAMRFLQRVPALVAAAAANSAFPTRPYFSAYTSNPIPFENLTS
jgi:hypothetical protein